MRNFNILIHSKSRQIAVIELMLDKFRLILKYELKVPHHSLAKNHTLLKSRQLN